MLLSVAQLVVTTVFIRLPEEERKPLVVAHNPREFICALRMRGKCNDLGRLNLN